MSVLAKPHGSIGNTIATRNLSINRGIIDASINLIVMNIATTTGHITTTCIGALQSGGVTGRIFGQMGDVSTRTTGVVNTPVGK